MIHWSEFYDAECVCAQSLHGRYVVEPANPASNLLYNMQPRGWKGLLRLASISLAQLDDEASTMKDVFRIAAVDKDGAAAHGRVLQAAGFLFIPQVLAQPTVTQAVTLHFEHIPIHPMSER